ncbi:family 16 glycosylhydrolase, partial [archaeon]|nr:family 16 glycosylhydrolase [archaeon]
NPEVDVLEHYGHWPWRYHYALHQWGLDGAASKHDEKRFAVFGMEEDFHTYGALIDEQFIVIYFDGVELHRANPPDCVKVPLFPLVNLALGPGWPTDQTPDPSVMFVDYVKIWQKDRD